METGLMHKIGDVEALTRHIALLHEDRALLDKLRAAALRASPGFTWKAAGVALLDSYRETLAACKLVGPRRAGHVVCV